MQDEINKNKAITANSEQLAALKAQFPSCFDKEGRFRPDKLEDIVRASGADITREGYKLDWLGKSYARLLANLKTETLLAPNAEHNALPENAKSENLLIQGDNLDVLKHLVNAYSEKVKMIYIDPPYNTGSDGFVYNDTRKFTVAELQRLAGVEEEEAQRILDFTQSASNSHSAWLTFMYPRLYVARELLREDGVIFISIDDNEQAQLKLLGDEVFGAENFVASIPCRKRTAKTDVPYGISQDFDTILCWAKSDCLMGIAHDRKYRTSTDFPNDRWRLSDLTTQQGEADRENSAFDMINPKNGKVFPFDPNRTWAVTEDTFGEYYKAGKIVFPGDYDFLKIERPAFRVFESEDIAKSLKKYNLPKPIKAVSTLLPQNIGLTKNGSDEIIALFGRKVFSHSKPTGLLQFLVQIVSDQKATVLDFFAGSGSTAHAVMALNAQDGGNRKHISVQLDEPTDEKSEARKAGYNTIFEVTRERIKRAAAKIKEDHPEATCDFGFKEFKTIPANEGPFQGYLDDAATLEDYVPFNGMALDEDAITALLTTWKAYDGLPLHQDLIPVDLDGYTAYQGGDKLYFVNRGLDIKHITALLARIDDDDSFTPRKIVVFHYRFNDKQLREFSEAVNAPNRKHLQLDFIQRF